MAVNFKLIRRATLVVGGASLLGAASGFTSAMAGHRKDSAKEGAIIGATLGAVSLYGAYRAAKLFGKAKEGGKLMFRRIRGRIVPIRV